MRSSRETGNAPRSVSEVLRLPRGTTIGLRSPPRGPRRRDAARPSSRIADGCRHRGRTRAHGGSGLHRNKLNQIKRPGRAQTTSIARRNTAAGNSRARTTDCCRARNSTMAGHAGHPPRGFPEPSQELRLQRLAYHRHETSLAPKKCYLSAIYIKAIPVSNGPKWKPTDQKSTAPPPRSGSAPLPCPHARVDGWRT